MEEEMKREMGQREEMETLQSLVVMIDDVQSEGSEESVGRRKREVRESEGAGIRKMRAVLDENKARSLEMKRAEIMERLAGLD